MARVSLEMTSPTCPEKLATISPGSNNFLFSIKVHPRRAK
jgi:hypothetical protein